MTSRQLAAFFFTPLEPGIYRCNICELPRKQASRTGYTNLMSHLHSAHPTHPDEYAEFQRRNLTSLEAFGFADAVTSDMYDWLCWVVERNLPLCEVENPLTKKLVKMQSTSVVTLKTYMKRVATRVGTALAEAMGTSFGIMYDGWTSGTHLFVGGFAVFHTGSGLSERLVGLSPMEDGQTADDHIEFMSAILDIYGKTTEMIKFFVGDNCDTNQSLVTKLGVPLVGYASHRFNLAMSLFLSDYDEQISQIRRLMTALRLPNNAALLERHTPLVAETPNLTRWTSVWKVIDKYIRIRDAAKHVGTVEDLLPHGSDHRRIVALHEKLKELNSVCENLQHHKRTLEEVRALFDACIETYPVMSKYLDADAKIVHAPCFEKAVVKAIRGGVLSRAEQTILEPFRAELPFEPEREPPTADFAAVVLREAKRPRLGRHSAVKYVSLLSTVTPTSNRCERLFFGMQVRLGVSPFFDAPGHLRETDVFESQSGLMERWDACTLEEQLTIQCKLRYCGSLFCLILQLLC